MIYAAVRALNFNYHTIELYHNLTTYEQISPLVIAAKYVNNVVIDNGCL